MPVNQVRVIWSGLPVVGNGLSTFNFSSTTGTAQQQATAVGTFLTATNDRRTTSITWTLDTDVPTLDVATGQLQAITTVTSAQALGTAAGDLIPFATQGLLRLFTGTIVGGRLLQGRIFLPGAVESDSNGGPTSTYMTDYDTAAAALVADANADWSVWSRTHGVLSSVAQGSTWNEWAVLRSRRD